MDTIFQTGSLLKHALVTLAPTLRTIICLRHDGDSCYLDKPPREVVHLEKKCHLLGFRFAPRIRDLADKRLYSIEKPEIYPALEPLIGARLDTKLIFQHWEDLLRLALRSSKEP